MADNHESETPKPHKWSSYMLEIYTNGRSTLPAKSVDIATLEEKARDVMKDDLSAYMYVSGNAGTHSTYHANRKAFEKWCIVPRQLRDTTERNLETTLFGTKYRSPLLMAPIGVQGIVHPDAELPGARAAAATGIPYIMSTSSSRSIEEVAQANGNGHRWYQLYWPRSNDITLSLLSRAKSSGFTTLLITLDTGTLGWRPHDLNQAYLPFGHGFGIQVGLSDPVFMARHNLAPIPNDHPKYPYDPDALERAIAGGDEKAKMMKFLGPRWLAETNSGYSKTWEDLKLIQENWEGPIVLKGIQSVADAENALDMGIHGIVVSNHGGRQIDGALPSLIALSQICSSPTILRAQKAGHFTVLFDSGIRTGSDIIKAMALGAQGVLLGRLYMYGLIIGSQAGVEQVIKQTLADLDITLGLSGYKDLSEIQGKGEEIIQKIDL